MKIKIQQFLFNGTLFSWEHVGKSLGKEFIKLGHEVDFISSDGIKEKHVPPELKKYVQLKPTTENYDMQLSYTFPGNFPQYLAHGKYNRFGIWNYDAYIPPPEAIKYHVFCDKFMPSSNFSTEIFRKAGIPNSKLITIPHGINLEDFKNKNKLRLNTNKKIKILFNIATPHLRKNIKNTLKAYGEAFNKNDDVCLVIKISSPKCSSRNIPQKKKNKKKPNQIFLKRGFEINFNNILQDFKKKYKNHGEIEVINGFVPSLVELYNTCDILFMMSNFECFFLPGLEGLASDCLVIASNWGGQTHYLNENNSLLIDGDIVRMPTNYQYWSASVMSSMIQPNINDAVNKLKFAVKEYNDIMNQFRPHIIKTVNSLTWHNAAKQILSHVN